MTDLSKKFSQLREDFKYNLSLLEARDNEIRRLEGVGNALNSHLQTLQAEKSSLMNRLEKMLSREQERKERAKSDAAMQKVRFAGFQPVLLCLRCVLVSIC